MRILLVITRGDSIGGAQLYVRDLASRMQDDGHEVLVAIGSPGALQAMLAERGVATVACPHLQRAMHPARDLRAVGALARIIRQFQPDLVSTHSSKAGLVGRLASRRAGVPCVFTAHGWAFADGVREPGRSVWLAIERAAERLATRIICVSNSDRNLALNAGFDPARLVTVHNGVVEEDPAFAARQPVRTNVPARIVMVARFAPQKDHRTLIAAVAAIPGCELDLVGDGPLRAQMEALADRLGIRHRVRFHGHQANVAGLLAQASIFVLASRHEGFPLTTLEAMRAGLPTVVTDVGGAGEAVTDGVTGYLVPRGDVAALRHRLRILVEQPSLRRQMGDSARASYLQSFTFERMYETTLAVYRDAIGAPTRSRYLPSHPAPAMPNAPHQDWRSPWA